MAVLLAPFTIEHYANALALWQRTPGVGLSEADSAVAIERFLARNPGLSRVALIEGQLVGTILIGHDGRRGLIHHLAVDQQQRRQGVAGQLVRAGLAALREQGIFKCHAFVYRDNQLGQAFWQAIGAEYRATLAIYSLATDQELPE
ncbi:MAG: hypothetical protein Fur005_43180 [Roseiflexaceae bacterium]